MDFESSFRMFLESFRLPGEAQKIARVMEAFGAEYYAQCPDVFHDPDVVYVLAYSTILLNTDQHNPMVRCAHCHAATRAAATAAAFDQRAGTGGAIANDHTLAGHWIRGRQPHHKPLVLGTVLS